MACTQKILTDNSVAPIESPFMLTSISRVTQVRTELTLPSGTAYNSHDASHGVLSVDANTPNLLIWVIDVLNKNETATLDLELIIISEAEFSETDRTVYAQTDAVPNEENLINNDADKEVCGFTASDVLTGGTVGGDTIIINNQTDIINNFYDNGLIYGGAVWTGTGLNFDVTSTRFAIDGLIYTNDPASVTLSAADPTDPRIDVIITSTDGTVSVVEGTPSPDPVKPEIDLSTQVEVTFVQVPAGATTPGGFANTDIYQENLGEPAEWNASENTGVTNINLQSDSCNYAGTYGIEFNNVENNNTILFTTSTPVNTSTIDQLTFRIESGGYWGNGTLEFTWLDGVTPVSNTVVFGHDPLIFNSYNTTEWRLQAISSAQFGFTGANADTLRIVSKKTPRSFCIDDIRYIEGVVTPPIGPDTSIYAGDGTIAETRNVQVNADVNWNLNNSTFSVIGDNTFNNDYVRFTDIESLQIFATQNLAANEAFALFDADAGIDFRFRDSLGDDHSITITTTSLVIEREAPTGDSKISLFDTDNGKIALDATTYRFGDGAGGNLPATDASPTHVATVRSADGHILRTTLADLAAALPNGTIYTTDDTIGAGRTATVTDTLTFSMPTNGILKLAGDNISGNPYIQFSNTTTTNADYAGFIVGMDSSEQAQIWNTYTTGIEFRIPSGITFKMNNDGTIRAYNYGSGTNTGTETYTANFTADGSVVEGPLNIYLADGTIPDGGRDITFGATNSGMFWDNMTNQFLIINPTYDFQAPVDFRSQQTTSDAVGVLHLRHRGTTNGVVSDGLVIRRETDGGSPLDGIGTSIEFQIQDEDGISINNLIFDLTDVTTASADARMRVQLEEAGTSSDKFTINSTGEIIFNEYNGATFTSGTPAGNLAVTATGNVMVTSLTSDNIYNTSDTLTGNRQVTLSGNNLVFRESATKEVRINDAGNFPMLQVESDSTAAGSFSCTSGAHQALSASATGGTSTVSFTHSSGAGQCLLASQTGSGSAIQANNIQANIPALIAQKNTGTGLTNDVDEVFQITRLQSVGTSTNGIGARQAFFVENDVGIGHGTAYIDAVLTDVTNGSEDGELRFAVGNNGSAPGTVMTLLTTGQLVLNNYDGATFTTGTSAGILNVTATGEVFVSSATIDTIYTANGTIDESGADRTVTVAATDSLIFTGAATAGQGTVVVEKTGGSSAFPALQAYVTGTNSGSAINTFSDNGNSTVVITQSGIGNALTANSDGTVARFVTNRASTNNVETVISLSRTSSGTAANNIGARIDWLVQDAGGTNSVVAHTDVELTTATAGSEVADFVWDLADGAGGVNESMRLTGDTGQLRLTKYDGATVTGTSAGNLAITSTGDVIEEPIVKSIYVPVYDSNVNAASKSTGIVLAIGQELNGFELTEVISAVFTLGSTTGSETLDVQVVRRRAGASVNMLSTAVTIEDSQYTAKDGVINAANDDVAEGDLLLIDVTDNYVTSPAQGLAVTLEFTKP